MTHKRSWLALGALLAAIIGGTVWAAEQEKKAPPAAYPQGVVSLNNYCDTPKDKKCCDEKCCTKDEAKTCCEGKGCTDKKDKGCCADGKCCGCCEKAKQTVTLPVTPGSSVQVLVAPPTPGMAYDMPFAPPPPCLAMPPVSDRSCGSSWAAATMPQPTQPMQYTPVAQCVPTAYPVTPLPPQAPACAAQPQCNPWKVRAIVEKDRTCLEMQLNAGGEETCAYSDTMTLKIGKESLKLAVVDKQVQVHGSFVKGSADTVTRNSADGSIFLEGHVKLKYEKAGQKAEVTAERVAVGVADGRLEVKPVEQLQVFGIGIGYFR